MRRGLLALALAAVAGLPALAAAAPPRAGVLVPGESLGGIRLGLTPAQVAAAWGARHGVCRGCERPTWYFTYRPFRPEGAGVVFERGRVVHAFTHWQPSGWRTSRGVTLGAGEAEVTRVYRALLRRSCGAYDALVLPGRRAATVFYLLDGELWGFGLTRPDASPCL